MRNEDRLKIAVIDGQGGGIGKHIVEQLRKRFPELYILALGTNALATGAMVRAGASEGASGEGAICFNANRVDIIAGSFAIMMVYELLGEITPQMAAALSASKAENCCCPSSGGAYSLWEFPAVPSLIRLKLWSMRWRSA